MYSEAATSTNMVRMPLFICHIVLLGIRLFSHVDSYFIHRTTSTDPWIPLATGYASKVGPRTEYPVCSTQSATDAVRRGTSLGMSAKAFPIYYVDSFSFTHLNLGLLIYIEIRDSLNGRSVSGHTPRAGGRGCIDNVGLGGNIPDSYSLSRVVGG